MKLPLSIFLCAITSLCQASLSNEEISEFGGCYFAPMTSVGLWRMRTQTGAIREFESTGQGNKLRGVGGWTAEINKGEVRVRAPAERHYPPRVYNFKNGRLESLDVEGKHCRFSYPNPLVYEDEEICPLWPDVEPVDDDQLSEMITTWKGNDRLKLWFASPNQAGVFLSFIVLVFLSLAISPHSIFVKCLFFAVTLAVVIPLALTQSRSAVLATIFGSAVVVICRLKAKGMLHVKRVLFFVMVIFLCGAAILSAAYLKGRTLAGDRHSDSQRCELLSAVPMMMHDAPFGFDTIKDVGRTYSRWYQSFDVSKHRFNLVSDQLTILVRLGWFRGGLYIFVCLAGMLLLVKFAWCGGSVIPAAVWVSLGTVSLLNVVLLAPYVSWIPLASLSILGFDRRWMRRDFWPAPLIVAVCCAVVVEGLLFAGSQYLPRKIIDMRHECRRTIINGHESKIWIVDDDAVLGPPETTYEIRRFYSVLPKAEAIGYVKEISDLPQKGISRLVLAGAAGGKFLQNLQSHGQKMMLPREVIFLSPDFSPNAVPLSLLAQTRARYVIGEFAARYHADLADPPKWCTIVPGAEIYIPGWMRFCVN